MPADDYVGALVDRAEPDAEDALAQIGVQPPAHRFVVAMRGPGVTVITGTDDHDEAARVVGALQEFVDAPIHWRAWAGASALSSRAAGLLKLVRMRNECARRPNFDHPFRLNIDQGWKPVSKEAGCG